MARKKDLHGAIARGADMFFSVNDAQVAAVVNDAKVAQTDKIPYIADKVYDAHEVDVAQHDAQDIQEQHAHYDTHAYKAQDANQEDLETKSRDMRNKLEAAETRRTQGRKGYKMPRVSISLAPSAMEYVRIMAGITGKSITQYISDMVDKDAEVHAERYQRAKEIIKDVR